MERRRVPGYITTKVDNNFGLNVKVERQVYPKSDFTSSGDPSTEGKAALGENSIVHAYREVIPPGKIGSEEGDDFDKLGPPQYISTIEYQRGEALNTKLHNSVHAEASADQTAIPFQGYATFEPRSAPMPRAAQDEGYLERYPNISADPEMTNYDSTTVIGPRDARRRNLGDPNRDAMAEAGPDPIGGKVKI